MQHTVKLLITKFMQLQKQFIATMQFHSNIFIKSFYKIKKDIQYRKV